MSFAIAFAGGGTRGAAHVGVLLALAKEKIAPAAVAGTSAGSIVAGLYGLGFSPRELREILKELSKTGPRLIDPDYLGLMRAVYQFFERKPVTFSGLIKGRRLERYLFGLTDGKTIRDVKMRTLIPAVDLDSGDTMVYTDTLAGVAPAPGSRWETEITLAAAMRASSAVPAVFQPKRIGDSCLVDGGVTDLLPVQLLIAAGEQDVLAVDLEGRYHGPACNNVIEIASHSLSVMSRRLRDCTGEGEKLLLKPKLPKGAGLLTFDLMEACMEAGYEATMAMMPKIREIFGLTEAVN